MLVSSVNQTAQWYYIYVYMYGPNVFGMIWEVLWLAPPKRAMCIRSTCAKHSHTKNSIHVRNLWTYDTKTLVKTLYISYTSLHFPIMERKDDMQCAYSMMYVNNEYVHRRFVKSDNH